MTFTPPLFCFILLFIIFCCTSFYLFVLCSNLLFTLSLTCPCPLLHYAVRFISALHVVFLPCNSAGLQIPPLIVFVLDHPFINQMLSFLPSTLLKWVLSCVPLSHRLEFLQSWSVSLAALITTFPSIQQPPTTALLADTMLLRLFTAHTLPYINSVLGLQALFWILELWGWDQ